MWFKYVLLCHICIYTNIKHGEVMANTRPWMVSHTDQFIFLYILIHQQNERWYSQYTHTTNPPVCCGGCFIYVSEMLFLLYLLPTYNEINNLLFLFVPLMVLLAVFWSPLSKRRRTRTFVRCVFVFYCCWFKIGLPFFLIV